MKFNLHSKQVSAMAEQYNCDRLTAMARLHAIEVGITESELNAYLALFHKHMDNGVGFMESMQKSAIEIIANQFLNTNLQFSFSKN